MMLIGSNLVNEGDNAVNTILASLFLLYYIRFECLKRAQSKYITTKITKYFKESCKSVYHNYSALVSLVEYQGCLSYT